MNELLIKKVLEKYGLEVFEILPSQKGYRNISTPIITSKGKVSLVLYKDEVGISKIIKNTNTVSNFLADKNLPTRKSFKNILKISSGNQTRFLSLYNYLDGETIPWEAYTKDHIKVLGMTMSKMHFTLKDLELNSLPKVLEIMISQLEQMGKYFSDDKVIEAINRKLDLKINKKLFPFFRNLFSELEKEKSQILHMDFVRSNILFGSSGNLNINDVFITGILDFEKTAFGPRIIDIARTLAFLIVDCKYKKEEKIRKYFLESGYKKRGSISLPDLKNLNALINFFLVYDFYKFLIHNPYEFLCDNEHYLRTKDILLKNNLLS